MDGPRSGSWMDDTGAGGQPSRAEFEALTTRLSQHARRVVAPTHWLISTQIIKLLTFVEAELAKEE